MRRLTLPGSSLSVFPICLGAASFGSGCSKEQAFDLIDQYRARGGNLLDTAHCYAFWTPAGAGASERVLGDYLRRMGKGDLAISTKGGHPGQDGYRAADNWLSAKVVQQDLEESLTRLQVDRVELYWLHRDDTRMPVDEIVDILDAHVRAGRIGAIGASNWHRDRIAEANAYALRAGRTPFLGSQVKWNLACSPSEQPKGTGTEMRCLSREDRNWHSREQLPVFAYSSTANGFFASGGTRGEGGPQARLRLERTQTLARKLGATPGQVALSWLMQQPFPVIPILGTTHPDHLEEALGAVCLEFHDQIAWLEGEG